MIIKYVPEISVDENGQEQKETRSDQNEGVPGIVLRIRIVILLH